MAQPEPERLPLAALGPLPEAVEAHLEAIRALCREYGVVRLELFGSALTSGFDPETSDIDLLVEYPQDYDFGLWLGRYFELNGRLEALLERPVDLVMADAVRKPRFIEAIRDTRRLLYAA
ncbi:MAG: nucleotidyltransferase domain-containing protein [Chloroflexota bacterium]|nr:nucleotidyltransferase domain-containing protein [Chloroflexota bacterium]